ncbi:carboxymuconolactone decarboxylase family protein [[Enterobacter] lignolyticus]|uniref:Alkylhydroperoxidase like protein, AhpD family n=2 Tax=[Enterobacter] lignolyticus TaxID=1334193 RepID=E3G8E5_ENTLS|nr:carboxymuconolactone decarboxylase family protein [[Enterobacter] lignolyticus]ADO46334.1 alkylhydroperoxidase like protein, AhpD family [[Enterobacter] lignolyticus SCF1]ALR78704.1 alkylhydroperoxidase [[Enterobacter] lignolyticus]
MSRLADIREQDATGKTADLFAAMRKMMGKVPNTYLAIGGHAPEVMAQALQHNAMLHKSSLSKREQEAINLAVSEATGCDYCLAAHTMMAKMAGYTPEQVKALRRGDYPEDAHLDALVKFVQKVVSTRNTLPEADVSAFRNAGFNDQQVIETLSAVSAILFTNMVNRVIDPVIDFPKAE